MPRFPFKLSRVTKAAPVTSPPMPPATQVAMVEQGLNYNSPFSPGQPLIPYQGYGGEPRRFSFPTGYNVRARPSRDGRIPFETLKNLIDNYDIARMAIGHRIDDVRSLDYSLTAKRGYDGDAGAAIEQAYDILAYPEGPGSVTPFRAWLAMWLEDILRYDAGTLYRRRDRLNRVCGLKVLSGITIAPTLDYWGDTPTPPAVAYTQFTNGLPWKEYTTDDIIYIPFRPQPDSPYGFAPLESVLLTANTDLRFQTHFLNWFKEGNVPEGFMSAPGDLSSPDQLREFQQYYDAEYTGDEAAKHQLKIVPDGTKFDWGPQKTFDEKFSEYLMRKVAAAFHVVPADLGFTETVNKATGDTQIDVQFRTGTLPLIQHVSDILNAYLQQDRGLPVEFSFDTGQEIEDRLATAQADAVYIQNGVVSASFIAEKVYGISEPEGQTVPRYIFSTRGGPIPLSALFAVAGPVDQETGAPLPGAPLPHKPFAPIEGTSPMKPPDSPPLAVVRYPADNAASVQAEAVQDNAAVVKSDGITAVSGIVGHDLIGDDDDDVEDAADELEKAVAYELTRFRTFSKGRRRKGEWRDFTFTAVDPVEAARLNTAGREQVTKATDGDPRWHDAPVRKVEEKLVVHHADGILDGLSAAASKDQLKALAAAYVASRTK